MKKQKKEQLSRSVKTILILLAITSIIFFVTTFYKGYHNVDLVYNYAQIVDGVNEVNKQYGGNVTIEINTLNEATDTGSDFIEKPLSYYYIRGMNQMEFAFTWGLLSMIFLGLLLGEKLNGKLEVK